MNLSQWIASNPQAFVDTSGGYTRIYANIEGDAYRQLWHLADYGVSSVCGPSVVMFKRDPNRPVS